MTRFTLLLFILYLSDPMISGAQILQTGRVLSIDSLPLEGATITLKATSIQTSTDATGTFKLTIPSTGVTAVVSHMGYESQQVTLQPTPGRPIIILLAPSLHQLAEVTLNTGYQELSRDRATGSFSRINTELLNRRVSGDILSRLENTAPGLTFNRNRGANNSISVRGQSTLFSNPDPLIILDNFPYAGDIGNINPNDVESVTILKDAAAASIWGARAGNGVIVITTIKAKRNQRTSITFNANVTAGERPDPFYQPVMSTSDFIELEKTLFARGFYQSTETSASRAALSPVVELLISKRDGKLSPAQADAEIERLKSFDVRNDVKNYLYRSAIQQQYAFAIRGASANHRYALSFGNDRNVSETVGSKSNRTTLNFTNSVNFFGDKAELTAGVILTRRNETSTRSVTSLSDIALTSGSQNTVLPYTQLADEFGNPVAITQNYRRTYLAGLSGLQSWDFVPLNESRNLQSKASDYRINTGMKYQLAKPLTVNLLYQFVNGGTDYRNVRGQDSYFTRDLINRYAQVSGPNVSYPIPLGAVADVRTSDLKSQNFRAQLGYTNSWKDKVHELSAIAGFEVQQVHTLSNSSRLYGYDASHSTSAKVDYVTLYRQSFNAASQLAIPNADSESLLKDHYRSYFANGGYTYNSKYTFTASARLDQSNLFGVNTNQKGVPLWSAGLKWDLDKEDFYRVPFLPELKLRATYGFSGNVNKSMTAYTTAIYLNASTIGLPYANIQNPPNPELRWEKVKTLNFGVDFSSANRIVSGTIEVYRKSGIDLIGDNPYPGSSGITLFRSNYANTTGNGIDAALTANIFRKTLKWTADLLYSHLTERVTNYKTNATALNYVSGGDFGGFPLIGRPLYALYSYRWAGLDPQTGEPQGYLGNDISKDYTKIVTQTPSAELVYSGSSRPTTFGAFRNTLTWKGISASVNIAYRMGYFFREEGVNYALVLQGQGYFFGQYARRWQKPGDESFTQVPAAPATVNTNRDNMYRYADLLVKRADNIRLQDVNVSYSFSQKASSRLGLNGLQLYTYVNNLGILWKAYKGGLDPDFASSSFRPVKTISAGVRVNL